VLFLALHAGIAGLPHADEHSGLRWVYGSCAEAAEHGAVTHMHAPGIGAPRHECLACIAAAAAVWVLAGSRAIVVPAVAVRASESSGARATGSPGCVLPYRRAPPPLS
jgi:hypothetical protein